MPNIRQPLFVRLHRKVSLKLLPAQFMNDGSRAPRFEREARARLNQAMNLAAELANKPLCINSIESLPS
jgi:hypothetical protein